MNLDSIRDQCVISVMKRNWNALTTKLTQTFTLPYKMKYWKCNLCNIELPDDELATIRKQRHREFHIDESVGTHKRRRNWTFGEVKYVLT